MRIDKTEKEFRDVMRGHYVSAGLQEALIQGFNLEFRPAPPEKLSYEELETLARGLAGHLAFEHQPPSPEGGCFTCDLLSRAREAGLLGEQ